MSSYRFDPVPDCPRLHRLTVESNVLDKFLGRHASMDERELRLRPYKRFLLAGSLNEMLGGSLAHDLRTVLLDPQRAGVIADFSSVAPDPVQCLKLGTTLTHMIGQPKRDPSGGTYFAWLTVEGPSHPSSYQLGADSSLVLHTDGVYEAGETDWIFFMKTREQNACGGKSRVLHLEDWPELPRFLEHPLAFHRFVFKSELFDIPAVEKSFLYRDRGGIRIRMNDQEAQPRNLAESQFIEDLLQSLQNSDGCRTLDLPIGAALLLNNNIWLHGRDPFQPDPNLLRQIIRQRGHFSETV